MTPDPISRVAASALPSAASLAAFADVPVRLSVEVGSAGLSLAELLALEPGGLVELDRAASEPLDILANGALIARGEVVSVDGRFAVRVINVAAATGDAWPTLERRR